MGEKISTLSMKPKLESIKLNYIISNNVLGFGVSGKVFKIKSISDKKYYALKILKDNAKSRRELEFHLIASNDCDNIVQIKDIYKNLYNNENCLLVVMEYMSGGELFSHIQERCKTSQFTEREAVEIVKQICLAISRLHSMDIAHRDLKPENLLFATQDCRAKLKLTDFGFAKEAADNVNTLKTPCYTPYYVAPEVLGPEKYNKSCDMWSLGVITYILLCGYPPFYATNGQPISPGMKCRIRRGEYNFPKEEWGLVSSEAKDLICNLLKTDPSQRLTIEDVWVHPWLVEHTAVPETPLATGKVLLEERELWTEVKDGINEALRQMRVDEVFPLKPIHESNNGLLNKRKKRETSHPRIIQETIKEEKSETNESANMDITNLDDDSKVSQFLSPAMDEKL